MIRHTSLSGIVIVLAILGMTSLLSSCMTSMNVMSSDIPVAFEDAELQSSSILKNQTCVKLQSGNQQAMLGRIDRVLCADNRLFVFDKGNNKLVAFDNNGSFISSTVNMVGHAKNEYIHLNDVALDDINRRIYLYCDRPYQMLIVDYDLNVTECVPLKELLLEIAVDSEYLYALYPDLSDFSKYDVRCYRKDNLTGDPVILIKQDKAIPNTLGIGKLLCRSGDYIYTCLPFDNTIYKIADGKIIQDWQINLGDRWFDYNKSKDLKEMAFFSANRDTHWSIQNIIASDSDVLFNTNKTNVFRLSIKSNDCVGFLRFINDSIPFSNSLFIPTSGNYDVSFSIRAEQIVDYRKFYEDRNKPLSAGTLNSIIESYSSDDNPLLILYNLK